MKNSLIWLVASFLWASHQSYGAESLSISYWLDTSLLYSDHLSRPNTSFDNPPFDKQFSSKKDLKRQDAPEEAFTQSQSRGARTLGLKHMKLGLELASVADSSLSLVIRPDATLERTENGRAKDFDGRSGDVYRNKPDIELLDRYTLNFHLGSQTTISAGVLGAIAPSQQSYLSPLEFGLKTVMPQVVSGIKVEFDLKNPPTPKAQAMPDEGAKYNLWLHNGRADRGEYLEYGSDSYDKAPSGKDSSLQMALTAEFQLDPNQKIFSAIGYGDESLAESGKLNELFLVFAYKRITYTNNLKILTTVDSRLAQERWDLDQGRYASLSQRSLAITNLIKLNATQHIVQGLHYGESDRHQGDKTLTETLKGWQLDLGFIEQSRQNVNLGLYLALEDRKTDLSSNSNGFRGDEDSSSYLMRFAFEIQYYLNKP